MGLVGALTGAFLIGALLRYRRRHWILAWGVSCIVVPAFVILAEFVLPYDGGGASMWPMAVIIGGAYGATAGAGGVVLGWLLRRDDPQPDVQPPTGTSGDDMAGRRSRVP